MEDKGFSLQDARKQRRRHEQGSLTMKSFDKTCAWTPMKSSNELNFLGPTTRASIDSSKRTMNCNERPDIPQVTRSERIPYGFSPNLQGHALTNTGMTPMHPMETPRHPLQEALSPRFSFNNGVAVISSECTDGRNEMPLAPFHISNKVYRNRSASKFTSHLLTAKPQELGIAPHCNTPPLINKFSPLKKRVSEQMPAVLPEEPHAKVLFPIVPSVEIDYAHKQFATTLPWQIDRKELSPTASKSFQKSTPNPPPNSNEEPKLVGMTEGGGVSEDHSIFDQKVEKKRLSNKGTSAGYVDTVMTTMKWNSSNLNEKNNNNKIKADDATRNTVSIDPKLTAHMQAVSRTNENEKDEKDEKEEKEEKEEREEREEKNAVPSIEVSKKEMSKKIKKNSEYYCGCKKSSCLRLYCACFAASKTCNPSQCGCKKCKNRDELNQERQKAIKHLLFRDPKAFSIQRPTKSERKAALLKSSAKNKPCNCKNSKCLKKYCECFFSSEFCTSKCRCTNCENYKGSLNLEKKQGKGKKPIKSNSAVQH